MTWLDADDQPDPRRWLPVWVIDPQAGCMVPGYRCRACGWVALRRSLPTGHECLGRQRDWARDDAVTRASRARYAAGIRWTHTQHVRIIGVPWDS